MFEAESLDKVEKAMCSYQHEMFRFVIDRQAFGFPKARGFDNKIYVALPLPRTTAAIRTTARTRWVALALQFATAALHVVARNEFAVQHMP